MKNVAFNLSFVRKFDINANIYLYFVTINACIVYQTIQYQNLQKKKKNTNF